MKKKRKKLNVRLRMPPPERLIIDKKKEINKKAKRIKDANDE